MTTKTLCKCGHEISQHSYSEKFTGCDIEKCDCDLDMGLFVDQQAARIAALEAENARLTAAHAMQNESLVVLPRHMVNSIEEQLKSLQKFAENCAKLEGQEYQVLVDEARIALAGG